MFPLLKRYFIGIWFAIPMVSICIGSMVLAEDKEWKPFVIGTEIPKPVEAKAFDQIRSGMSLKEIVTLIGPGYIPSTSGSGMIHWGCTDGRKLTISHTSNKNAIVIKDGQGSTDKPWMRMENAKGMKLDIPEKRD